MPVQSYFPGYPQETRGVGITFDQEATPFGGFRVYVKSLQSGASADRSGRVRKSDTLGRVNGVDVFGRPIAFLRSLIPGPSGSAVRLGFRRNDGRFYEVSLIRNSPKLGPKGHKFYTAATYGAWASQPVGFQGAEEGASHQQAGYPGSYPYPFPGYGWPQYGMPQYGVPTVKKAQSPQPEEEGVEVKGTQV